MDNIYRIPLTQEYETRGCKVTIDAASDSNCVDINVKNLKSGYSENFRYVLLPGNDKGYTDNDIHQIKDGLNDLLDKLGESEWNEIHFTNQILS